MTTDLLRVDMVTLCLHHPKALQIHCRLAAPVCLLYRPSITWGAWGYQGVVVVQELQREPASF